MSYGSTTITIPQAVAPDTSTVKTIQRQLATTKDPAQRQRLMVQAALEARYAQDMAGAQNQVQAAAQTPGAGVIYGGGNTAQIRAAAARRKMVQDAALRYNMARGVAPLEAKKSTTDWSY